MRPKGVLKQKVSTVSQTFMKKINQNKIFENLNTWLSVATSMYALLKRNMSTEHPTETHSCPSSL